MKLLKTSNAVSPAEVQDENTGNGIMIVDDSKFSRNILKDILKNEGFEVIAEARNGLEAVEMTRQKRPKYIFMDVEMPVLDGLGAIPKILEVDPSVHIIMCTAMGQKNIIVEAARAGAKDYVLKPYKRENIIRVLSVFIDSQQKDGQIIPFKGVRKNQGQVQENEIRTQGIILPAEEEQSRENIYEVQSVVNVLEAQGTENNPKDVSAEHLCGVQSITNSSEAQSEEKIPEEAMEPLELMNETDAVAGEELLSPPDYLAGYAADKPRDLHDVHDENDAFPEPLQMKEESGVFLESLDTPDEETDSAKVPADSGDIGLPGDLSGIETDPEADPEAGEDSSNTENTDETGNDIEEKISLTEEDCPAAFTEEEKPEDTIREEGAAGPAPVDIEEKPEAVMQEEVITYSVSAEEEVMEGAVREELTQDPAPIMEEEISEDAAWEDITKEADPDGDQPDAKEWEKSAEVLEPDAEESGIEAGNDTLDTEVFEKDEERASDISRADDGDHSYVTEGEKNDKAALRQKGTLIRADIRKLVAAGADLTDNFVDYRDYSYLWENRFELRQEEASFRIRGNRTISARYILQIGSNGYGFHEKSLPERGILTGMITAYLCQGNRLQQEDTEIGVKINARTEGTRIFAGLILEKENPETTDITMEEILRIPPDTKHQADQVIFEKKNLKNAVSQLVSSKTVRALEPTEKGF